MSDAALDHRLLSDTAAIAPARKAIESFAEQHGFDAAAAGEIGLCVNEAIANVIRHAYAGAAGKPIELHATMHGATLEIDLRDWGSGKMPDLTWDKPDAELLTPGGLGLRCLKKLMDKIEFVPQPDGMVLRMRRQKR